MLTLVQKLVLIQSGSYNKTGIDQVARLIADVLTESDIEAKEILRLRNRLYDILAKHTGQKPDKVEKDCDRNLWLDPEETIKYGLADRILQKAPEIVRQQEQE